MKHKMLQVALAALIFYGSVSAWAEQPVDIFEGVPDEELQDPSQKLVIESAEGEVLNAAPTSSQSGLRITLPIIRRGSTMFAEVEIMGKRVRMMIDTGASLTTLTPRFAQSVGLLPSKGAPTMQFNTANGVTQSRLGIIKMMKLGTQNVPRVTFGTCPSCGGAVIDGKPVVGLLGMNVLRRYRLNVDAKKDSVDLDVNLSVTDRTADLGPWLAFRPMPQISPPKKKEKQKSKITYPVELKNRSPYTMRQVVMELTCESSGQSSRFTTKPVSIRPRKSKRVSFQLLLAKPCEQVSVDVVDGSW